MSKDWPSKQPKPEGNGNLFGPEQDGAPATGFSTPPTVPQDRGGPGAGNPPNNKKIH